MKADSVHTADSQGKVKVLEGISVVRNMGPVVWGIKTSFSFQAHRLGEALRRGNEHSGCPKQKANTGELSTHQGLFVCLLEFIEKAGGRDNSGSQFSSLHSAWVPEVKPRSPACVTSTPTH